MDDHDLGALLDATVPVATASEKALSRIHRRAGQRRRRTALAAGALTVVLAAGVALGLTSLGATSNNGSVTPAGSTSTQGGTTTTVPDRPVAGTDCPPGSITLTIVPVTNTALLGALQWEVTATAHTNFLCRVHEGLEASIETPDGTPIGAIAGNPAGPNASFRDLFRPQETGSAAYVTWSGPCIDRPMQLDVGPAHPGSPYANTAPLRLAKQPCTSRPVGGSRLGISGAVREP